MRRIIYILITFILFTSCSVKKSGITNRTYHRVTSWYNTIFNGNEALEKELETKRKSYKDEFSTLLKVEPIDPFVDESEDEYNMDLISMKENLGMKDQLKKGDLQGMANSLFGSSPTSQSEGFDRAIEKGKLAIGKHSMLVKGKEYNSMMGEAYLMVGRAYYYKKNPFEAMNYYNYMNSTLVKNRKLNKAKIYTALAQAQAGNTFQADEIYEELKLAKLKKSDKKIFSKAYSQFLIDEQRYDEAITALDVAKKYNKGKYNAGRYNFIQGQLSEKSGNEEDALKYYQIAYKKKPSPELEIKSQIELAKFFKGDSTEYKKKIKFLSKMLRKGLYQSRKNEILYAMAVVSLQDGKTEQAMEYLKKSLKEKESDPHVRALAYQKTGDYYFDKADYLYAGVYYDSAVSRFTSQAMKAKLEVKNKSLKEITQKYYLIKKNDSILAVVKMSPGQKKEYYQTYIDKLKQEEELARLEYEKKMEEESFKSTFQTETLADDNAGLVSTPIPAGQKWYFYNKTLKQKGQADFKRLWGNRALVDNWRVSKQISSLEDMKSDLLGQEKSKNPRRFEVEYYTDKLPTNMDEISKLKMQRDSAELSLGLIYYEKINDIKAGTASLEHLVSTPPFDESITQAAMYNLYKFNKEEGKELSKKYADLITSRYPESKYADYILHPESENKKNKTRSSEAVTFYEETYKKYAEGKYKEAKDLVEQALKKYPTDEIMAKFSLLYAYCDAKMGNKQAFLDQLERVSLVYENTPEGKKADEVLNYFLKQEKENSGKEIPKKEEVKNQTKTLGQGKIKTNIKGTSKKELLPDAKAFEEQDKKIPKR